MITLLCPKQGKKIKISKKKKYKYEQLIHIGLMENGKLFL